VRFGERNETTLIDNASEAAGLSVLRDEVGLIVLGGEVSLSLLGDETGSNKTM
jgi:hypothetical protein